MRHVEIGNQLVEEQRLPGEAENPKRAGEPVSPPSSWRVRSSVAARPIDEGEIGGGIIGLAPVRYVTRE
jgi:hypothetical protein